MGSEFYLITGASKGIGRALAQTIVAKGQTVLGVSRGRPEGLAAAGYHHVAYDLSDTAGLEGIVAAAEQIIGRQRFDFVCLVNNASATEPIGLIERCPAPEIDAHLHIGLVAPMILTSLFIDRFAAVQSRKKVAFISSGLAFQAMAGESVYCSAKAGLAMFAQSVGLEQAGRENGFEVLSIGPGMVDTGMQLTIRSKSSDEFAKADFFKQAHAEGRLQDPERVAVQIYTLLANRYEQGSYVQTSEVEAAK